MFHTLRIEWMKVKNYRTFWILLAITVVSLPAFNYTIYDLTDNAFPKVQGQNLLGKPFSFPDVWQTVCWNSGLLLLIPAVLIITLTTNEFTYKTHRQNIIDGWTRTQFINIKLFEVLLFSVFVTLVVFATCLVFGISVKHDPGVSIYKNARFVLFFFVEMLSYSLIAFLLGLFIKRAGLAMGAFFIYMILEQFAVALLRHKYHVQGVDYLPEEVTDILIPQPFGRRLMGPDKLKIWESHLSGYIVTAVVYVILYYGVSNWRFRKSDL
jgi:hypothetical protein